MLDPIESMDQIDSSNWLPSFFKLLFDGITNTNGLTFGIGLILIVGAVSFLVFKSWSFDRALITSSMITWVTALLCLKAGWINGWIFTLTCIYVVVGLYYLFNARSQEEA